MGDEAKPSVSSLTSPAALLFESFSGEGFMSIILRDIGIATLLGYAAYGFVASTVMTCHGSF